MLKAIIIYFGKTNYLIGNKNRSFKAGNTWAMITNSWKAIVPNEIHPAMPHNTKSKWRNICFVSSSDKGYYLNIFILRKVLTSTDATLITPSFNPSIMSKCHINNNN